MSLSTCNTYSKALKIIAFTLVNCAASCLLDYTKKGKAGDTALKPDPRYQKSIANLGAEHLYPMLVGIPEDVYNILKNCSKGTANYKKLFYSEPTVENIRRLRLMLLMYFQFQPLPKEERELGSLGPARLEELDKVFRAFCAYDSGLQNFAQHLVDNTIKLKVKDGSNKKVDLSRPMSEWVTHLVEMFLSVGKFNDLLSSGKTSSDKQPK
ncbi:MAG: hypothetical protein K2X94_02930 [Amoebophilaceae bacterium]|nr:hypothetical protein [Amoebophilaceae bacterium]